MSKKTLIIGASENPERYSFKAATQLTHHGHEVILFSVKPGSFNRQPFITEFPEHIENLDTVTLYINPRIQEQYYAKVLALKPQRVLFNPGTENPEFERMCTEQGIKAEEACTLVLLSLGQY